MLILSRPSCLSVPKDTSLKNRDISGAWTNSTASVICQEGQARQTLCRILVLRILYLPGSCGRLEFKGDSSLRTIVEFHHAVSKVTNDFMTLGSLTVVNVPEQVKL